jgi:ubiquinone/menaquinone biosynthesis C-methylase UbiE
MAKHWKGERLETFVFNESTVEHLHRYAIAAQVVKDKVVLDFACGEGYGSNLLSALAQSVIGIDKDRSTIDAARDKYRKSNLKFFEGDVGHIPLDDGSIDVVVSFETLEHTMKQELMLQEIRRVLKRDGILIISTPNKMFYSDFTGYSNPFHEQELYEDQFQTLINKYFVNCQFLRQASTFCSIISTHDTSPMVIFKGDFESVEVTDSIKPVYVIAIATNNNLLSLPSSVFEGESIFQRALLEKETDVKRTLSYRVGNFLLMPFKLIRSMFR